MPSRRLPLLRRPVVMLCALMLGLCGLLGVASRAVAYPYASDSDPSLTLPTDATFVLGRPGGTYVIEADGSELPAIGVDLLPAGLRLIVHGDGSATIAGTPKGPAGTTIVQVTAQSPAGSVTESLPVTIQQAPAFVDQVPIVFVDGEFASRLVRTVGFPAPGIGLEGDLPAGLTFVDNGDGTATIVGTPVDGPLAAPITLTAVNVVADASVTTSVRVVEQSQDVEHSPDVTGRPAGTVHPAERQREP